MTKTYIWTWKNFIGFVDLYEGEHLGHKHFTRCLNTILLVLDRCSLSFQSFIVDFRNDSYISLCKVNDQDTLSTPKHQYLLWMTFLTDKVCQLSWTWLKKLPLHQWLLIYSTLRYDTCVSVKVIILFKNYSPSQL